MVDRDTVGGVASIQELLERYRNGDKAALNTLWELVYVQLKPIAQNLVNGGRHRNRFEATSLVHDAYTRLVKSNNVEVHNLEHFLSLAARVMRHALIDQIRGLDATPAPLDKIDPFSEDTRAWEWPLATSMDVNDALDALSEHDQRAADTVTLKYVMDMSLLDISRHQKRSQSIVGRDLRMALAYLRDWLRRKGGYDH